MAGLIPENAEGGFIGMLGEQIAQAEKQLFTKRQEAIVQEGDADMRN
jgi:hypothetical protein